MLTAGLLPEQMYSGDSLIRRRVLRNQASGGTGKLASGDDGTSGAWDAKLPHRVSAVKATNLRRWRGLLSPFDRHTGPARSVPQSVIGSAEDGGIADVDAAEDAARTMSAAFELLVKSGTACENAAKVISITRELADISKQTSAMLEKLVWPHAPLSEMSTSFIPAVQCVADGDE